jgi:hypothetical protein
LFHATGTLGGTVLVGCVSIPVFALLCEKVRESEWPLRDVRIVPACPVSGKVRKKKF